MYKKEMDEIIAKFAMEVEKDIKNTVISLAKQYKLNEKEALNYIMREKEKSNNERIEGVKRGRPKKEKSEEEKKEKDPRVRPPKEKKIGKMYEGDD